MTIIPTTRGVFLRNWLSAAKIARYVPRVLFEHRYGQRSLTQGRKCSHLGRHRAKAERTPSPLADPRHCHAPRTCAGPVMRPTPLVSEVARRKRTKSKRYECLLTLEDNALHFPTLGSLTASRATQQRSREGCKNRVSTPPLRTYARFDLAWHRSSFLFPAMKIKGDRCRGARANGKRQTWDGRGSASRWRRVALSGGH